MFYALTDLFWFSAFANVHQNLPSELLYSFSYLNLNSCPDLFLSILGGGQ